MVGIKNKLLCFLSDSLEITFILYIKLGSRLTVGPQFLELLI